MVLNVKNQWVPDQKALATQRDEQRQKEIAALVTEEVKSQAKSTSDSDSDKSDNGHANPQANAHVAAGQASDGHTEQKDRVSARIRSIFSS